MLGYSQASSHEYDTMGKDGSFGANRTKPNRLDSNDKGVIAKLVVRRPPATASRPRWKAVIRRPIPTSCVTPRLIPASARCRATTTANAARQYRIRAQADQRLLRPDDRPPVAPGHED